MCTPSDSSKTTDQQTNDTGSPGGDIPSPIHSADRAEDNVEPPQAGLANETPLASATSKTSTQPLKKHRSWGTFLLTAVCVAVYVLETIYQIEQKNKEDHFDTGTFIAFGGAIYSLIFEKGQIYRLLTDSIVHGNFVHIFGNIIYIVYIGRKIEKNFGVNVLFSVYIVSAVVGSSFSVLFNPHNLVTIGASGAIFGLLAFGGLAPFLSRWTSRAIPSVITPGIIGGLVGIQLGEYFWIDQQNTSDLKIDYMDHLGGAVGGLVLGV